MKVNEFQGKDEAQYYCWVSRKEQYKDKTGNVRITQNTVKLKKTIQLNDLVQLLLNTFQDFMVHEATILNQYMHH